LKRLDLAGQFDTIVTAADVPVSKPDPAPYRLTMERLAAQTGRPVRGVAVEDSPAGIQAAHEAGLKVLAVTHTHPASELFAADRIIDNFESLPSGEVLALIGGAS
jgi:beta-phosphoglucomutase-like phosphatase (HAD superfamily)